ncbi:MAG: hypothetical protein GDA43_24865 [Hormoscilla sp. SP5CHS1]|nr:hypothetical protein [Hormoscilla sp. SP12CHS1]MBC6456010.1 hypothetical protein [Hormoscilla sp. SP5CHS1]
MRLFELHSIAPAARAPPHYYPRSGLEGDRAYWLDGQPVSGKLAARVKE